MSSKSRRHRRSSGGRSFSPANAEPTHFMKIILPGNIHAQNIRIPREFVRRFENELCSSSEATISVPDGRVWNMELKKCQDEEVWLCKGWDAFMKYYSIRFGFFLVFKYEGNSQFSVIIVDASAAEIYYPRKVNNPEEQKPASEQRRKRPHSFDHCGYNTRSQRHNLDEEKEEEIIDIDVGDDNALSSHSISGNKDRSGQRAMEANHNLESENPPYFATTIRAAHLNRRYIDVPASFWKVYLCKNGPMKLQDCKGRKWKVNYTKCSSALRIHKNWINFARANNLKEGDECVFELIKRNNQFVFQCLNGSGGEREFRI